MSADDNLFRGDRGPQGDHGQVGDAGSEGPVGRAGPEGHVGAQGEAGKASALTPRRVYILAAFLVLLMLGGAFRFQASDNRIQINTSHILTITHREQLTNWELCQALNQTVDNLNHFIDATIVSAQASSAESSAQKAVRIKSYLASKASKRKCGARPVAPK